MRQVLKTKLMENICHTVSLEYNLKILLKFASYCILPDKIFIFLLHKHHCCLEEDHLFILVDKHKLVPLATSLFQIMQQEVVTY